MPKKKPIKGKPKVNKELEGLEIKINEFGQIITSYDVKDINKFLNRNIDDKKLRDRDDISDEGEFMNMEETDEDTLFYDVEEEDIDIDPKFKDEAEDEDLGEIDEANDK